MSLNSETARVYEFSFLLLLHLAEEEQESKVASFISAITDAKGEVISQGATELIELAYDMGKVINNENKIFSTGHFGWVKFEIDADQIEGLTKNFTADTDVLRALIIKTVREDTVITNPLAKENDSADESSEDEKESTEEKTDSEE